MPTNSLYPMQILLQQLGRPGADKDRIANDVLKNPALVAEVVDGLNHETARVKYGCAKILRLVAERQPGLLYPHFDFFAGLLDNTNRILQWEAIIVLSHLARVDSGNKFSALFGRYFTPIAGPVMITAGNIIASAPRIALARPLWADPIAVEVLKVARARYQTAECRNVAIGHAILALDGLFDLLSDKAPALRFVRHQLKNSRNATRAKAGQFLKKRATG